ncbi:MAG: NAD(+) synthase, partial [Thermodesulfobacteriota bacterium]|nr:NAD(+) synthase [Thermodesulfobacteriota bacterium]
MKTEKVVDHIVSWLVDYCDKAKMKGFVVGVS